MKRTLSIVMFIGVALTCAAQDTYLNTQITNQADVIGTARFVGMGGAMGALGADISTISSNPAGIAMMKKTDVSITAGGVWQGQKCPYSFGYSPAHATVDQAGFVSSFKTGNDDGLVNFNFGFNYQKKIDYNQAFGGATATNASLIDVLNNSSVKSFQDGIFSPYQQVREGGQSVAVYNMATFYGAYPTTRSDYATSGNCTAVSSSGFLASYDFSLSANISNRYFFGLTFGVDNVRFNQDVYYGEIGQYQCTDNNLEFVNHQEVRGHGFNLKLGGIVRPFEDNSFRIGLAIETPTWYKLNYCDDQALYTNIVDDVNGTRYSHNLNGQTLYGHYVNDHNENYNANYLDYKLVTPWKFRVQAGGTIGTQLALGMEYEYAMYNWTTMKYPNGWYGSTSDAGIDDWTERMIKGQHSLRLGLEFKPIDKLALRAGYNAISSVYEDGAYWDNRASTNAIHYPTSFQYTNFGMTNIITVGIGYRSKYFYADLAYKCRLQNGNHYAFNSMQQIDDTEWSQAYEDRYFQGIDYGMEDAARQAGGMSAIPVSMTRHSIVATLGVKF